MHLAGPISNTIYLIKKKQKKNVFFVVGLSSLSRDLSPVMKARVGRFIFKYFINNIIIGYFTFLHFFLYKIASRGVWNKIYRIESNRPSGYLSRCSLGLPRYRFYLCTCVLPLPLSLFVVSLHYNFHNVSLYKI